jgi:hypothetical protein
MRRAGSASPGKQRRVKTPHESSAKSAWLLQSPARVAFWQGKAAFSVASLRYLAQFKA